MHFFEEEAAVRYGVVPAVILQNIYFWVKKNEANQDEHYKDGRYWTYNSERAFTVLFPYLTKWQIRTALKKLESQGAIMTGNFNKSAYDRTLWYTVTDEAMALLDHRVGKTADSTLDSSDFQIGKNQNDKLDFCNLGVEESQNGNGENPTPIPDRNTDRNDTDRNTDRNADVGTGKPSTRTPGKRTPKDAYGEFQRVKLTSDELNTLVNLHGEEATKAAIRFLDEYIEEKGDKYKSHYMALRRWVFDAVKEREAKRGKKPGGGYDWDNL